MRGRGGGWGRGCLGRQLGIPRTRRLWRPRDSYPLAPMLGGAHCLRGSPCRFAGAQRGPRVHFGTHKVEAGEPGHPRWDHVVCPVSPWSVTLNRLSRGPGPLEWPAARLAPLLASSLPAFLSLLEGGGEKLGFVCLVVWFWVFVSFCFFSPRCKIMKFRGSLGGKHPLLPLQGLLTRSELSTGTSAVSAS